MKITYWWVILITLMFSISGTVFFLRLGNEFVPRTGRVHIAYDAEEGYRFIRNGLPFYVGGAGGNGYFEELKHSGGNAIRIYEPDSLPAALARAAELDLVVIADLPLPAYKATEGFYGVPERSDSIRAATRNIVLQHKDHPALLCWILGNEINYTPGDTTFTDDFDALIAMIRQEDPNHPIGTALISHQLIEMHLSPRSTGLDFVALNIFGSLRDFEVKKNWFRLAWTGPYLFSEWGINGPWESEETAWGAPLEPTSAKKAEQLGERYEAYVGNIADGRCLGSMAFYWGWKYERTHTWFSFFSEDGLKSQACHTLKNIWTGTNDPFSGIAINYLLLGGEGARDNVVLQGGAKVEATALYHDWGGRLKSFEWSVREEDWYYIAVDSLRPLPLPSLISGQSPDRVSFVAPAKPGPYRLHLDVTDSTGYFATANVPFYVLNSPARE